MNTLVSQEMKTYTQYKHNFILRIKLSYVFLLTTVAITRLNTKIF
jgi:hypothetical protein